MLRGRDLQISHLVTISCILYAFSNRPRSRGDGGFPPIPDYMVGLTLVCVRAVMEIDIFAYKAYLLRNLARRPSYEASTRTRFLQLLKMS